MTTYSYNITQERWFDVSDETKNSLRDQAMAEGWGVVERRWGMIMLFEHTVLRTIEATQEAATKLAGKLNQDEGYVEYEIGGDPESSVYESLSFHAERVVLDAIEARICAKYNYRRVQENE